MENRYSARQHLRNEAVVSEVAPLVAEGALKGTDDGKNAEYIARPRLQRVKQLLIIVAEAFCLMRLFTLDLIAEPSSIPSNHLCNTDEHKNREEEPRFRANHIQRLRVQLGQVMPAPHID